MSNPPANTTAALWRFWEAFKAAEPDSVLGGIYAAKGGYHNTRANHVAGRANGSPDDYSIQRPADRRGPGDKASALDITFKSAQRGDYRIIAKYSKRLMAAGRNRDRRFYDGEIAIVREFFGNVADDGKVDGWSWYRERSASSDPSHLWHIHLSITRAYVGDWSKLAPILDVLLGRSGAPAPSPVPEDDMPITDADAHKIAQATWNYTRTLSDAVTKMAGWPAGMEASAWGLLAGADGAESALLKLAASEAGREALQASLLDALKTAVGELRGELDGDLSDADAAKVADRVTLALIGAVTAAQDLPGQPAGDE